MASGPAYGTAELADLCSFAWPASGLARVKAISRAVARDPRRTRALLSLRALPVVELGLTAADQDRWLRSRWPAGGQRLFDGNWAQAVIQTSPDQQEYLTGKHRQAVRTNIRRARELGIVASRLGGYDEFVTAATPVYESRPGGEEVLTDMKLPVATEDFAWYSASAASEAEPVIIAAVALFGDFGVLAVMVGHRGYAHVGYARYLLHTFILSDLAARGTRHLVVGSVVRESSGNRYFQRLLGYTVCNLRPVQLDLHEMLVSPPGERREPQTAALRRMLMRGPALEDSYRPPREASQRITSPARQAEHRDEQVMGAGVAADGEEQSSAR